MALKRKKINISELIHQYDDSDKSKKFKKNKIYRIPYPLLYCITSRYYLTNTTWRCDKCKEKNTNWSFYCTLCDYDLCFDCFKKHKK